MKIFIAPILLLLCTAQSWAQCTVTTTQMNATCYGNCDGSATANSSGPSPYTYLWSTGQTTQTISNLCAGTYTVSVTDGNNCTGTSTATITEPPAFNGTITSVTNVYCNSMCNGNATMSVSGGVAPYTYLWNTNPFQTTAAVSGVCAGTYTVVATDANGCTTTNTVNITQPPTLSVSYSSVNMVSCYNSCDGSATVTGGGGTPPYTYLWSPSNWTTPTVTGLCAGTYTVTITDANGCTSLNMLTITQPPALTVTPAILNQVTCSNGCNGAASVNVFGGTAPYAFSGWPNNQTTATATGLCAGQYTVTVTDNAGCTGTTTFTLSQTAVFYDSTVSAGASCASCCDGSSTAYPVGGTGPYSFQWLPGGQTTASVNGLCTGNYSVYVTDANGCSSYSAITIQDGNSCGSSFYSYLDSQNTNIMWVVNMASGAQPLTYTWNWGDGSPDDYTPYPSHTYQASGAYNITLTIVDNLSCTSSSSNGIYINRMMEIPGSAPTTVYVIPPPNITGDGVGDETLSSWSLFPNPAESFTAITYTLTTTAEVSVHIYDILGNKVVDLVNSTEHAAGNYVTGIDASRLLPGMYLVKLNVNGRSVTKRLLILNN
jgi:large repetitive protein